MTRPAGGPWRALRIAAVSLGVLVLLWSAGPAILHAVHRSGTPEGEREAQRRRYAELSGRPGPDPAARAEQRAIFLWFHARGWNIDEGWHESWPGRRRREWRELLDYWRL